MLAPIEMPPQSEWREMTGEMIWLGHPDDCPFDDRPVRETRYAAALPVAACAGTYWKSTQFHDGMRVWWWGGIHPVDFAAGWTATGRRPDGVDRWGRSETGTLEGGAP